MIDRGEVLGTAKFLYLKVLRRHLRDQIIPQVSRGNVLQKLLILWNCISISTKNGRDLLASVEYFFNAFIRDQESLFQRDSVLDGLGSCHQFYG